MQGLEVTVQIIHADCGLSQHFNHTVCKLSEYIMGGEDSIVFKETSTTTVKETDSRPGLCTEFLDTKLEI